MSTGSSPRARGTAVRLGLWPRRLRFIPACAGNGNFGRTDQCRVTVHPRVRGERHGGKLDAMDSRGSSPRARGTVGLTNRNIEPIRFIPACAGNGGFRSNFFMISAVHPRVRGERPKCSRSTMPAHGSSPRARGTERSHRVGSSCSRFIPACAGNGDPVPPRRPRVPVHPRVRGERFNNLLIEAGRAGSSPRARGTERFSAADTFGRRFIPACAGNGPSLERGSLPDTVHPRVRGERLPVFCAASASVGSSPRARGTDAEPGRRRPPHRFIPACAGNGGSPRTRPTLRPVHPRVRGERSWQVAPSTVPAGSSPRARGTEHGAGRIDLHGRFIPACAGNGQS